VWHKENRYIAYTSANIIIVEQLNQEKTQTILREGNDKIYQLKLSPNGRLLLAFTRHGEIDGFPCIILFDSATLQKMNHISIPDHELVACEFSKNSNMLLVLSKSPSTSSEDPTGYISQVALWDFLDGHKDIMCKSHLPLNLLDMRWNFYLGDSLEFVTVAERQYHYWKITPNLTLQYQEGEIPKKRDLFASRDDKLTTCEFAVPMPD
jgi:WD40 repeat protein